MGLFRRRRADPLRQLTLLVFLNAIQKDVDHIEIRWMKKADIPPGEGGYLDLDKLDQDDSVAAVFYTQGRKRWIEMAPPAKLLGPMIDLLTGWCGFEDTFLGRKAYNGDFTLSTGARDASMPEFVRCRMRIGRPEGEPPNAFIELLEAKPPPEPDEPAKPRRRRRFGFGLS